MLASLIELYGPDLLSNAQVNVYKWSYSLVYQSNGARLEVFDSEGLLGCRVYRQRSLHNGTRNASSSTFTTASSLIIEFVGSSLSPG